MRHKCLCSCDASGGCVRMRFEYGSLSCLGSVAFSGMRRGGNKTEESYRVKRKGVLGIEGTW